MGIVLVHILQWILRIILFLLLFLLVLIVTVLLIPIRYQAEGKLLEKRPDIRGKATWFFRFVYVKFFYEKEFHLQIRIFGFLVYDTHPEVVLKKKKSKEVSTVKQKIGEEKSTATGEMKSEKKSVMSEFISDETQMVCEKPVADESKIKLAEDSQKGEQITLVEENSKEGSSEESGQLQDQLRMEEDSEDIFSETEEIFERKKTSGNKGKNKKKNIFVEIKNKIKGFIRKLKDIKVSLCNEKIKIDYYLELWNRKETQVTFQRAKKKLGKMITAILPRKWCVTGEVGFEDPATTGYLMGALGSLYPITKGRIQIVPNFENVVLNLEVALKGHIRLGNLVYQIISLLLNKHCFKFIKMIFEELDSSEKKKEI